MIWELLLSLVATAILGFIVGRDILFYWKVDWNFSQTPTYLINAKDKYMRNATEEERNGIQLLFETPLRLIAATCVLVGSLTLNVIFVARALNI